MTEISLAAGDWQAAIAPNIGGSIAALTLRGIDVLRRFDSGAAQPLDASCFPLVPFCNRVAQARFAWDGRKVVMRPNHVPEPHRLHGIGWHRAWEVSVKDRSGAIMVHANDGRSEWPWAYRAEQGLALDHAGCTLSLRLTNLDEKPMPAGIGLHPYFRRRPETRARFMAGSIIAVGDDMIPTGVALAADALAPFATGTELPDETIDHCYTDWSGVVHIEDELGTITMTATHAPHLHVFAPADGSALCFEPVNHLPDALNQAPQTMPVLANGESLTLEMRIEASLR